MAPRRGSNKKTGWHWEQPDPMVSGSSGDLAKLFRNEGVKQPGIFANQAPSATATIMAREVIQNSWDAANDLRSSMEELGERAPTFTIEFRFRSLEGSEKTMLANRLHLHALRDHVDQVNRQQLGLGDTDCLDHLDDGEPLRVLEVRESGASGMYGPFEGARSKLYLALISLGYTVKHQGAGGSFGFGKAGLIQASRIRSLVAYTCFRERPDDPGVTRRLLGMTYWGQHEVDSAAYNGFARLGEEVAGGRAPFTNGSADLIAENLGLTPRDSDDATQLGTSFLLVDPAVDAEDLSRAIARNWWPALTDRAFVVKVVDAAGKSHPPRPMKDPALQSFVRGYELAVMSQDNTVVHEHRKKLSRTHAIPGRPLDTGTVGLVANLDGWSYPDAPVDSDDDGTTAHRSLVALVRGPRMVVEYLEVGTQPPFVRGTFVAAEEIDDLLRQSEPKAHDSWETSLDVEGIDPAAPKIAAVVLRNIKDEVRDFRKLLKPPLPREEDIHLPMLQDLMRKLLTGKGPVPPPPPPPETRLLSVRVEQSLEAAGTDEVLVDANVFVWLSDHVSDDTSEVEFDLHYRFVEDGRTGLDCTTTITPPAGFRAVGPGSFVGTLGHEPVEFRLRTEPYSSEWTGRLLADGRLRGEEADA